MRIAVPCALALLVASSAEAGLIRVPADYPSLLVGVDAAAAGDTVLVSAGTWTDTDTRGQVTACAFLSGGVSLISESGPDVTTIDLAGSGVGTIGVLVADQPDSVLVEGFTFTGRTIEVFQGTCLVGVSSRGVTVRGCRFVGNESMDIIAPALWARECRLTVEDTEFTNNRSDLSAAGIVWVLRSTFFFRNSIFRDNIGSIGVQVDTDNFAIPRPHIIEDCQFIDNKMVGSPLVLYGFPFDVRRCLFLRNTTTGLGGAIRADGKDVTIEFNTFAHDSAGSGGTGANGGAIQAEGTGPFDIRSNTFLGCHSDVRGGAVVASHASVRLENNVIAFSTGGTALGFVNGAILQSSTCNAFWMNEGGDIEGGELDPSDFTADPQFCDLSALDLTLHSTSPCATSSSGGCGLIGAWDVGCGPLSVRPESWGTIKSLYR